MAVTVGEMTAEVVAEPQQQLAGTGAVPAPERLDELARLRFALASALRLDQRTRAEGFDD